MPCGHLSLRCARVYVHVLKLGIQVSQATVAKYMMRQRKPPSETWRTLLENHVKQLVSTDFLVVSSVSCRLLFVFIVLGHRRRRAIPFNVTAHSTAEWTARQIAEALPWDNAPSYLLHDRDCILRSITSSASCGIGNPRSADGTTISLAERLCSAVYRLTATRVP